MDDLTFTLRQLCLRNRDGGYGTQGDRLRGLTLIGRQLKAAGFRQMKASSLKGKHVEVLLQRWQAEGLSIGTIKNRLSYLRWWAEKVGKAGLLPKDNAQLGIPQREYVTNQNKAVHPGETLAKVTDPHVQMSLKLQQAFGLRREESIKFQPGYADRGNYIQLKGSWTKGGRPRRIPLTTQEQRNVLNEAHCLAGKGSLIPAHKSYIQQRDKYDGQCQSLGLNRMHGLRHLYAQQRYEVLTGWKSPVTGGPSAKELTREQKTIDRLARQAISSELGHGRTQITAVYLGR